MICSYLLLEWHDHLMADLDSIDRQMIDILRRDGRASVPKLADQLGIARATAYNRFDRLVDEGVIDHFSAVIDPEAIGLGVAALVLVNADQAEWRQLQGELAALPHVEWVALATGPFDFVLLVRCEDLNQLRDVVLVGLHALAAVRTAQTVVLLDEPPVTVG